MSEFNEKTLSKEQISQEFKITLYKDVDGIYWLGSSEELAIQGIREFIKQTAEENV